MALGDDRPKCWKCGTPVVPDVDALSKALRELQPVPGRSRHGWPRGRNRGRTLAMRFMPRGPDSYGPDMEYWSPRKPDGHLIHCAFSGFITFGEFIKELQVRGYDLATMYFEVRKKEEPECAGNAKE